MPNKPNYVTFSDLYIVVLELGKDTLLSSSTKRFSDLFDLKVDKISHTFFLYPLYLRQQKVKLSYSNLKLSIGSNFEAL